MSVIEVNAISTQQVPGGGPRDRVYRSLYQVICDDYNDSPVRIYLQTSVVGSPLYLPQVNDWYAWDNLEYDDAAFVVRQPSIQLARAEVTRRVWNYVVTHTTESVSTTLTAGTARYDNPLSEPWSVRLMGDEWTEEALTDPTTGLLLGNSAGQPWTGRESEIYKSRSSWQLAKNYATLAHDLIDYSRGRVNSQPVRIRGKTYPVRTLLMRAIEAEELNHQKVGLYYKYSFRLDTNPATFDIQAPDEAPEHYDVSLTTARASITTYSVRRVSTRLNLLGFG